MRDAVKRTGALAIWALAAAAIVFAAGARVTFAAPQKPAESSPSAIISRLPANVRLYVHWHGTKSLITDQNKAALIHFWSDPQFAPMRRTMIAQILKQSASKTSPETVEERISLATSLLENEAIVGLVPPTAQKNAGGASKNLFVAYDAAGKAEQMKKAEQLFASKETPAGKKSSYMFGDAKIETVERPEGTDFNAQVGNYYINAEKKEIVEDLVTRFGTKAPASKLADDAVWKAASQNFVPGALLDAFVRFSPKDFEAFGYNEKFDAVKFADALHWERLHSWTISVGYADKAGRARAVVLGDTSPGSLFDIAGDSVPSFATQPLAREDASYLVSRINIQALFKILAGPVVDSLSAKQSADVKNGETLAGAFLGLPLPDVFALFGGEMAGITHPPSDPSNSDLYAFAIGNREGLLKLLHKVIASFIRSEQPDGDATLLEIATPYTDPLTKQQQTKIFYLALTPQMAIFAKKKEAIDDALARLHGGADSQAGALTGNADFQRARALLPANLSGFSFMQWNQETLQRYFAAAAGIMAQAKAIEKSAPKQGASALPENPDWLKSANLDALTQLIHFQASGWWKTADGVYLDFYLQ